LRAEVGRQSRPIGHWHSKGAFVSDTRSEEAAPIRLVETCGPVFGFLANFVREVEVGDTPSPEDARHQALSAFRDSEDLARSDAVTEKAWDDRVKAMMVYLLDYKMTHADWKGREFWRGKPFEADATILGHAELVGGEAFFRDCEQVQGEYEQAAYQAGMERIKLAGVLSLYFICLRLGFEGQYEGRPQELADFSSRLWQALPAYAKTRIKEMFPDAYEHDPGAGDVLSDRGVVAADVSGGVDECVERHRAVCGPVAGWGDWGRRGGGRRGGVGHRMTGPKGRPIK